MLQPGTCSATRSSSSTCVGPPGARATHCATQGSSRGTTLGPPEPTNVRREQRLHEIGQPVADRRARRRRCRRRCRRSPRRGRRCAPRSARRSGCRSTRTPRMAPGAGAGVVARAVVDDDDLEVGIGERVERRQAVVDRVGGVVGADHDRHLRPRARDRRGENGASANALAHGGQRRLRLPLPRRRGRTPSRATVWPPRHHSSVHEKATAPQAPSANAARMCIGGDARLPVRALAHAVGAGLGQQQRPARPRCAAAARDRRAGRLRGAGRR